MICIPDDFLYLSSDIKGEKYVLVCMNQKLCSERLNVEQSTNRINKTIQLQ